ncbi:MAG: M56 family metallopeptidase [Rhodothermales bacterium]
MNAYLDFLQYPVMDAIGAALLHFIWQGALVAGLLALVLYVFKQITANTRYALCAGALLLMFLLPVATALQHYFAVPDVSITSSGTVFSEDQSLNGVSFEGSSSEMLTGENSETPLVVPEASSTSTQNEGLLDRINSKMVIWRQLAVMIWVLGLVFFVLRLTNGLLTVRGLRRRALPLIDASDENASIAAIFKALQEKMGIENEPILATSDEIKQPLLIGWLKPIVLIPASVLAGLPANQLESILAHELAHVRRHDYLVLLGQSIVETLFFYHPAVWWVSSRMSIEQEYCCDEIAVATVQNKVVYVQALASLETSRLNKQFSLGANGGRLVDRIRQLVNPRQRTRLQVNRTSWIPLIVLLFACGSLFAACERVSVDESLPAEELFNQANELARAGQYGAAERTAEVAAEKGSICAVRLLLEITNPNIKPIYLKEKTIPAVSWAGQSERKLKEWSRIMVELLHEEANRGNARAKIWLSFLYKPRKFPSMLLHPDIEAEFNKNEEVSLRWMEEAAEINAQAKFLQAMSFIKSDENKAKNLFREAALMGYGPSFQLWAGYTGDMYEDPKPYFEVASIAIDSSAAGVHDWLGKTLAALQKQVDLKNALAIEWMMIVDSLQLKERLAQVPVSKPKMYNDWLMCPEVKSWRYP